MNKSFGNKMLYIALPSIVQQMVLSAVAFVDVMMVGMVDQTSMSAVALANQIQVVFNAFIAGVETGIVVFAAQYIGKDDIDKVERFFAIAVRLCFIIWAVFMLVSVCIPEILIGLLTSETALIEMAAGYLRWISISWLFYSLALVCHGIMRNCDRGIQSMVIRSVCIGLKLILNGMFILGWCGVPRLGIMGVAAATILYRLIELLWVLGVSLVNNKVQLRGRYLFCISKRQIGGELMNDLQKAFVKFILPVMGSTVTVSLGFSIYVSTIGRMGADAVAASSMAENIKSMGASIVAGIQYSCGIIIGQELGAEKIQNAKKFGARLIKIGLSCGIGAGLLMIGSIPIFGWILVLTHRAYSYLGKLIIIMSLNLVLESVIGVCQEILSAGGEQGYSFRCITASMWCVAVPLVLLAAYVWKWPMISIAICFRVDSVLKMVLLLRRYKKDKWLKNLAVY